MGDTVGGIGLFNRDSTTAGTVLRHRQIAQQIVEIAKIDRLCIGGGECDQRCSQGPGRVLGNSIVFRNANRRGGTVDGDIGQHVAGLGQGNGGCNDVQGGNTVGDPGTALGDSGRINLRDQNITKAGCSAVVLGNGQTAQNIILVECNGLIVRGGQGNRRTPQQPRGSLGDRIIFANTRQAGCARQGDITQHVAGVSEQYLVGTGIECHRRSAHAPGRRLGNVIILSNSNNGWGIGTVDRDGAQHVTGHGKINSGIGIQRGGATGGPSASTWLGNTCGVDLTNSNGTRAGPVLCHDQVA